MGTRERSLLVEFADVLAARRSVRRFSDDPIPEETLRTVLAAALAMPHAGNTYAWRAVVLRRRDRDERWSAILEAALGQRYIDEADVFVVWTVDPEKWVSNYRANLDRLLERGLIDPERAGGLLEAISTPPDREALHPPLIGEAMMGVAAVVMAAFDHGLAATLAGCRPGALARTLRLPRHIRVVPNGLVAIGYPADEVTARAEKPPLAEVYADGHWDRPLASP